MNPEQRLLRELEHLRRDSDAAAQFLYAWLAFHHVASKDKAAKAAVNRYAFYWNTSLGALQTSLFIVLGRIFDTDTRNHTIDRLLREAESNPQIFSRDALAARKMGQSPSAIWVRQYVKDAYEPSAADFRRLSSFVARKRTIYKKAYEKIRHQVFAHNAAGSDGKKDRLFSKTELGELQRLVLSLRSFHEAMWQLYFNGRKPEFSPARYSVSSMPKSLDEIPYNAPVEQRIFAETYSVIQQYSASAHNSLQGRG